MKKPSFADALLAFSRAALRTPCPAPACLAGDLLKAARGLFGPGRLIIRIDGGACAGLYSQGMAAGCRRAFQAYRGRVTAAGSEIVSEGVSFFAVASPPGGPSLINMALCCGGRVTAPEKEALRAFTGLLALADARCAVEEELRQSEETYRTLVNTGRDIIYSIDPLGRVTYISPQVRRYGYSQGDIIGRHISMFSHPEDRQDTVKALANAFRTGRTLPLIPYRARRKDGTYFSAEQKSGIVFKGGKPVSITGVIRDVSDRRELERELRGSAETLRKIFDNAPDAIFIKDPGGRYTRVNRACAEVLGLPADKVAGLDDFDFFKKAEAEDGRRQDERVLKAGETVVSDNARTAADGERRVYNVVKVPLRDVYGDITGLLGIARDVTRVRAMEAELVQKKAGELVSKLTGGMAHDFNNVLAAIDGYATLVYEGLKAGAAGKEEMRSIISSVKRAAAISDKLHDLPAGLKKRGRKN
ncbi:MAG: PAS/PAS domain-containing sensor histidine kinase response regulator [Elusimicrobia bacterium]|nr:MAG: PAS/PAS domain-containing sensor histidine kinase response regulator [Elusimicrobiota bacterium]KAF0154247.1 MAG: PAS/PAS domain-containing sensor histidine kinase response regulator [Elusimicrobiota bacterium]